MTQGDIVRLWQSILYAELDFPTGNIDGRFGPTTEAWTIDLQKREILDHDGWVGPETWGYFYTAAIQRNTALDISGWTGYRYVGGYHSFGLQKSTSTGQWRFVNPRTGAWTGTSH